MKDRIRQLMESQHMTQQTFADFLGISPATLSSIFNERTRPTLAMVEAIKQKIKAINTDWLLFGTGSMFIDESDNNDTSSTVQNGIQGDLFDAGKGLDKMPTNSSMAAYRGDEERYMGQRGNMSQQRSSRQQAISFQSQTVDVPYNRQITEIRVFYSDQTWETFVPKK